MEREWLNQRLEEGLSLSAIAARAGVSASTVSYWIKRFELRPESRAKYAPKGGLSKEVLEELVGAARTLAQMASALGVSVATVRYWLDKYEIRTAPPGMRTPEARAARQSGLTVARLVCRRHGQTEFILEGRGYYRCKRCRSEQVAKRRRRVKQILVAEAGGRCVLCGYDRYAGTLEFHHLDRSTKAFGLAQAGLTRGIDEARVEARKCVLLCANCHAEVEGGVVDLSSAA